jgi:Domain of unknown function (DUF1905)
MVDRFTAELWEWEARDSWFFLTLPEELADDIQARTDDTIRRGFGSLRVEATIGRTTWRTSIFPGQTGSYVLPVKKPVRTAESIEPGDTVGVSLVVEP